MEQPTADDLMGWLRDPLAESLGDRFGRLEISLLSRADTVADGTTILLLRDPGGQARAVALCSAPASPDMVQRAMRRAREAKSALGPTLGATILDPWVEGRVRGLSYAVLPYCNRLSDLRPVWWMQRALLRRPLFDWLWRATERTVREVDSAAIDRSFAELLRRVASLKVASKRMRVAAERSAERLQAGTWTPRHVLMHGDLWKGNIVIPPAECPVERSGSRDRFAIIDWAGSEIHGYAMYDLIRLAQSIRLNARILRHEVDRHCRVLRCEPVDAISHLLVALGYIANNLEHFPLDRYARMAESCLATMDGVTA